MANLVELRDLDQARLYLVQGLWLQRAVAPVPGRLESILEWMLEIVSSGQPLPAPGFVADLGHCIYSPLMLARREELRNIPGLPQGLLRIYEDYVLGKIYGDPAFERAGDALRAYKGRDQAKGLAFVLQRFRERADFLAVSFSPAVVKALARESFPQLLDAGWDSLCQEGVLPLLREVYESLVAAARRTADFLGSEDIFELEHRTALDDLGQRVALRQVLGAVDMLAGDLPSYRPPQKVHQAVATKILEEDTYPVGGFSSLSTKGTVESLLQSQLAFMEDGDRPDLFDVKYVRDELLYYARDENQFFRQRRTYVFVLSDELVQARYKDADLPYQRIILVLAWILATIRKLSDWLSEDTLVFEIALVQPEKAPPVLEAERKLLETLLMEQIANGTVVLRLASSEQEVSARCTQAARRCRCHCLAIGPGAQPLPGDDFSAGALQVAHGQPMLILPSETGAEKSAGDSWTQWQDALRQLLESWL
jgi:hypothetical protein